MSEKNETAKRQNEEVESKLTPLPGLDELVGRDEQVETTALQVAHSKLLAINLEHQRIGSGHKPDAPIPNNPPEEDGAYEVKRDGEVYGLYVAGKGEKLRTYKQHEKICEDAVTEVLTTARKRGLDEEKIKERSKALFKEALDQQKERQKIAATTPPPSRE